MRLWRLLPKRKATLLLIVLIGIVFILREILQERRRISLTKEILAALGSRNASALVRVNVNTTVINSGLCKPYGTDRSLQAVVVVISKPEEIEYRRNIRAKWGNWIGDFRNVQLIFFVGLPKDNNFEHIRAESEIHDDVVMDAMEESYYALTLKTLRMLKWFLSSCSNVKYLVKTDTDTFIHLPNLAKYLNTIESQPNVARKFIGGDIAQQPDVIDDPTNKWYMPPELLEPVHLSSGPGSPYPHYVLGGFYVLSNAIIPAIYSKSLTVPLIQFEDVFLTGIVAHKGLGLNLTRIPHVFSTFRAYYTFMFPSYYTDAIVACHLQGDMNLMNHYYEHHQSNYAKSLLNS